MRLCLLVSLLTAVASFPTRAPALASSPYATTSARRCRSHEYLDTPRTPYPETLTLTLADTQTLAQAQALALALALALTLSYDMRHYSNSSACS